MHRTRYELAPGILLDARHAVWFEEEAVLAVADLHVGFAWAERARGNMLPLGVVDDTVSRLIALTRDYPARELIVLGDVVQRAVPLRPVREALRELCSALAGVVRLRLLGGNHDRGLVQLLAECDLAIGVEPWARIGAHRLLHGDEVPAEWANELRDAGDKAESAGRIFMGHEHPAIRLGDGVASMKCPCFLLGPQVVILPAFSAWAAGSNVRQDSFMSPVARNANFTCAVAVMNGRLLRVPLR
jgi:putative SbcD/Mre11-related phosphoesterase